METPYLTHITTDDYKYVYEPAEDSFLLLDALEADLSNLVARRPSICLEIGSGSGILITAIANALKESACFAIDINPHACTVTKRTVSANNATVEVVNMSLLNGFRGNVVDLLIFNPPYVVTPDEELKLDADRNNPFNSNIIQSWAGGKDGRRIMDRVFKEMENILSPNGIAYILVIEENKPNEILNMMQIKGFSGCIVAERRIRGEHLFILRFNKEI